MRTVTASAHLAVAIDDGAAPSSCCRGHAGPTGTHRPCLPPAQLVGLAGARPGDDQLLRVEEDLEAEAAADIAGANTHLLGLHAERRRNARRCDPPCVPHQMSSVAAPPRPGAAIIGRVSIELMMTRLLTTSISKILRSSASAAAASAASVPAWSPATQLKARCSDIHHKVARPVERSPRRR